jgi:hypothetical protein
MAYEERLEAAARVAADMPTGEVHAMRYVPACDRAKFRLTALRIASRCGVRVRIESQGGTTSVVFYRDGMRP